MRKQIGAVYNSFITDIDLNAYLTFMFLCECNAMSHISESTIPIENNLTQPKEIDMLVYS